MPLDDFVAETVALLARPDATEILVDRVRFLREAEVRGDYPQVVATLNAADPHRSAAR
jgi:short-subunit dehydrogenase involved in D-alanine esterification of teichoic acids